MNLNELLTFGGISMVVVGGPIWLMTGKFESGFAIAGFLWLISSAVIGFAPGFRSMIRWLRDRTEHRQDNEHELPRD